MRNAPQNIIRTPGTVISAGSTGLMTVANDGVNMITSLPSNALQLTGTAFRLVGIIIIKRFIKHEYRLYSEDTQYNANLILDLFLYSLIALKVL